MREQVEDIRVAGGEREAALQARISQLEVELAAKKCRKSSSSSSTSSDGKKKRKAAESPMSKIDKTESVKRLLNDSSNQAADRSELKDEEPPAEQATQPAAATA